jgi:hypothetical protein
MCDGKLVNGPREELLKINEKNAHFLGEAFWNLTKHYGFSQKEQAALLGIKCNRQRLADLQKHKKVPTDPDKFARVGNLLGIHKNLRILYSNNRNIVYQWMHLQHDLFSGKSAIEFIMANEGDSFTRLFTVRRKLDQIAEFQQIHTCSNR